MKQLLFINSSPNGVRSFGYIFASEIIERLSEDSPGLSIIYRNLVSNPLTPLTEAYARAILGGANARDPSFEESERLIVEVERSDALIITTPIHNFSLPAALKLWIDKVVRAQRTFAQGPDGKVGLVSDRPVYIVISSGGLHRGPAANQPEFFTAYMRHVLGCIGLQDLRFIHLQGTAGGSRALKKAFDNARQQLRVEVQLPASERMA